MYIRTRRSGVAGRTKCTRNTRSAVRAISRCNARRRETHARFLFLPCSFWRFLSFSIFLSASYLPSHTQTLLVALPPCLRFSLTLSSSVSRAARPGEIGGVRGEARRLRRDSLRKRDKTCYARTHMCVYSSPIQSVLYTCNYPRGTLDVYMQQLYARACVYYNDR